MNTKLIKTASGVIHAAQQQGRTLPATIAIALDAACLLQSPETAAKVAALKVRRDELEELADSEAREIAALRNKVAELQARIDEVVAQRDDLLAGDPIPYALTPLADEEVRVTRSTAKLRTLLAGQRAAVAAEAPTLAEVDHARRIIAARDAYLTPILDACQPAMPELEADGITRRIAPTQALRAEETGR